MLCGALFLALLIGSGEIFHKIYSIPPIFTTQENFLKIIFPKK